MLARCKQVALAPLVVPEEMQEPEEKRDGRGGLGDRTGEAFKVILPVWPYRLRAEYWVLNHVPRTLNLIGMAFSPSLFRNAPGTAIVSGPVSAVVFLAVYVILWTTVCVVPAQVCECLVGIGVLSGRGRPASVHESENVLLSEEQQSAFFTDYWFTVLEHRYWGPCWRLPDGRAPPERPRMSLYGLAKSVTHLKPQSSGVVVRCCFSHKPRALAPHDASLASKCAIAKR